MRATISFAALLLAVSCTRADATESPREFVQRFCDTEASWGFRGLPGKGDEPRYDSLLGIELIKAIRSANSRVAEWVDHHSNSRENLMIPHIEANLFSGFSEGPTTFRVGSTLKTASGFTVEVHREYREKDTAHKWIDRVVLDRGQNGWVVRDIETHYFGSLLASIGEFKDSIEVDDDAHPNEVHRVPRKD